MSPSVCHWLNLYGVECVDLRLHRSRHSPYAWPSRRLFAWGDGLGGGAAAQYNENEESVMSQNSSGASVTLAMLSLVSGLIAMPVVAFVNAFLGILLLSLSILFIYKAS